MFEKTLSDLVKGLRSNKRREAEYVSKCIAEIKVLPCPPPTPTLLPPPWKDPGSGDDRPLSP